MDIFIILGLILVNGIFAMSEIAVVTSKRIRLQKLSENGSRGAQAALDLSDSPSRFLSTIQVGITLIGIFNGAFGEASLVERLTPEVALIPVVSVYAREIALAIVVVGITFASLILGELVPKRIAMQYPEVVASLVAAPMLWLSRLMGPFVKVLTGTTEFILRILGMHHKKDDAVTEEEIAGLFREGTDAGLFEKTEHDIVSRALRLDDQRVAGLMTPRLDVHFIDLEDPIEVNLAKIADSSYNRFPVCRGDISHVIGIVHAGSLFEQAIRGKAINTVDIAAATRPPLFVPETISAMQLLETLKKNRAELALVIDEYGEIEGIVTLSDVLGALVGDVSVIDEHHEVDGVRRDDGSWLIDGGVSFDRFRELLETDVRFPEEASGTYHTLAGFVMTFLGHIPQMSDSFEWEGYRIEVVDMDRNRIDRLLITKLEPSPDDVAPDEAG
ncbi:MAG: hemolysin family protein [Burkholderiaceae bacterium]|uniref:HlyC/CorC family transporter n=1 Tax=Herminiimonas contaminans TaxID=1111140 RepID=A0ABS0ETQ8_9BURK|nr:MULTISPECIES: hemolysin family protein [Oxalobacteraceae]MBF8178236.1 HlyC/CorC family transporter [Herminiimonas contaminans]MBX9801016.1 hemolysin family protein [Burkholderiaceae bacterium]